MHARDRLSDMQSFSEITNGAQILGLVPGNRPVWIITTVPIGAEAVTVYYKNESGKPEEQIVYQKDLHRLSIAEKELAGHSRPTLPTFAWRWKPCVFSWEASLIQ